MTNSQLQILNSDAALRLRFCRPGKSAVEFLSLRRVSLAGLDDFGFALLQRFRADGAWLPRRQHGTRVRAEQGRSQGAQDKKVGAPACSRLSAGFLGTPSATRRSGFPALRAGLFVLRRSRFAPPPTGTGGNLAGIIRERRTMRRRVNAIAGRLSLRPPRRPTGKKNYQKHKYPLT